MQVIPAINCLDMPCVSEKLLKAKSFLPKDGWIHIDVADARFTYNKTWGNPKELMALFEVHPELEFNTEIHLMVEEPEAVIKEWIASGAKRILVHLEALIDPRFRKQKFNPDKIIEDIVELCRKEGIQLMLSTNPETPIGFLERYINLFSFFQVLAVRPGLAGQKFLSVAIDKIRFIRHSKRDAIIEVDGGINLETGRLCREAGADILVAANYIFDAKKPEVTYGELVKI